MSEPKYEMNYPWLNIYSAQETVKNHKYHFFNKPLPGYQQVSLQRQGKRSLPMFYELESPQTRIAISEDDSVIRDFEHMNFGNMRAAEQIVIDRNSIVSESQWVKKYEPARFTDLLTDEKINRDLLTWLKSWDPIVFHKNHHHKIESHISSVFYSGKQKGGGTLGDNFYSNPKRIILLAGPPGCGKTTLIRVIANHCKYQVEEINASEDRSANNLIKKLEDIAGNETIRSNQKPTLICLDEVDGAAENQASGFSKVLDFIENGKSNKNDKREKAEKGEKDKAFKKPEPSFKAFNKFSNNNNNNNNNNNYQNRQKNQNSTDTCLNRPVIFICNDPFAKSLKELRSKAHVVYFNPLNSTRVVKRMKEILEKEKLYIELSVLQKISEICNNDIRSCIGILELVAKEKKNSGRNPKDVINRMKISFQKDNESTINDFMSRIFYHHDKKDGSGTEVVGASQSVLKKVEREVIEIGNPSLLLEYFLQNLLHVKGILRRGYLFLNLYKDIIKSDWLLRNSYRLNQELESYHMIPYANFLLHFRVDEYRKIDFPSKFFERLKKIKINKQILLDVYQKIPLTIRRFIHKDTIISSYLLVLYLSMQTSSSKEDEMNKCIYRMITYNFTFKKEHKDFQSSLFNPEIDAILTFGNRKPERLLSTITKGLMEQNFQFFKERKQLLSGNELKDSTQALLNKMQLQSRKKRKNEEGIRYKFLEGTGTKTSYVLNIGYFFK